MSVAVFFFEYLSFGQCAAANSIQENLKDRKWYWIFENLVKRKWIFWSWPVPVKITYMRMSVVSAWHLLQILKNG